MTYELVAVARSPSMSAPPTLTEVGPVVAPSISWTDKLEPPSELRFSCLADRLPSDVKARLRDLDENPTEMWLYRDGVKVFAGPLTGYQIQGGTLSGYAPDLAFYLSYMQVHADVTYTTTDQFTIAAGLVDQWQALDYGDFGIDTSAVGTSGVTRTITYVAREHHNVLQRVRELGAREDGFDFYVTPDRELVLV